MTARFVDAVRVGDVFEKKYNGQVFVVTEIHDAYAYVVDEDVTLPRRISLYALLERLHARRYTLLERGRTFG